MGRAHKLADCGEIIRSEALDGIQSARILQHHMKAAAIDDRGQVGLVPD